MSQRYAAPLTFRFAVIFLALATTVVVTAAQGQEDTTERTLVVLRGDASVTIQDGNFQFAVGDDGEIAQVKVKPALRGYLGAQVHDLSPELRIHFGAPEDAGVLVSKIDPGGPAATAGLQTGDVLTAMDGAAVETQIGFHRLERSLDSSDVVGLTFLRNGRYHQETALVTVKERPEVDVRSLVRSFGEGGASGAYQIDLETLELEIQKIEEKLGSEAWRARVQELQQVEGQLQDRLQSLNVEIQQVEEELREPQHR